MEFLRRAVFAALILSLHQGQAASSLAMSKPLSVPEFNCGQPAIEDGRDWNIINSQPGLLQSVKMVGGVIKHSSPPARRSPNWLDSLDLETFNRSAKSLKGVYSYLRCYPVKSSEYSINKPNSLEVGYGRLIEVASREFGFDSRTALCLMYRESKFARSSTTTLSQVTTQGLQHVNELLKSDQTGFASQWNAYFSALPNRVWNGRKLPGRGGTSYSLTMNHIRDSEEVDIAVAAVIITDYQRQVGEKIIEVAPKATISDLERSLMASLAYNVGVNAFSDFMPALFKNGQLDTDWLKTVLMKWPKVKDHVMTQKICMESGKIDVPPGYDASLREPPEQCRQVLAEAR